MAEEHDAIVGESTFPLELYEHIMDHLWDDVRTLTACTLVCRAWVPTCRHHLFHTVTLNSVKDCARLNKLIEAGQSSSSAAVHYFRTLSIVYDDKVATEWVNDWVPRLLPHLDGVEHLKAVLYDWSQTFRDTRQVIYTFSSRITSLQLDASYFDHPNDFFALLVACPLLTALRLSGIHCRRDSGAPTQSLATRRIILTELHLKEMQSYFAYLLVHWLFAAFADLTLNCLVWEDPMPVFGETVKVEARDTSVPLLTKVLQAIPYNCLRHLDLSFFNNYNPDVGQLDLSSFSQLETLAIYHSSVGDVEETYPCPWIPHVLSRLTSMRLCLLSFQFDLVPDAEENLALDFLDWAHLDEVIASLCSTRQGVRVAFHFKDCWRGSYDVCEIVHLLAGRLPTLRGTSVSAVVLHHYPLGFDFLVGKMVYDVREALLL